MCLLYEKYPHRSERKNSTSAELQLLQADPDTYEISPVRYDELRPLALARGKTTCIAYSEPRSQFVAWFNEAEFHIKVNVLRGP